MMKRMLTLALLVTMFAANPILAVWDAKDGYSKKVDELKDQAKTDASAELQAACNAWDDLEAAQAADKAGSTAATKKDVADAQKAFNDAVAKLDARFPSTLCKVEGFVTWPARKAGELLSSKWGARGATAVGLAAVAYCVYNIVNDNADEEDDVRTWA